MSARAWGLELDDQKWRRLFTMYDQTHKNACGRYYRPQAFLLRFFHFIINRRNDFDIPQISDCIEIDT